MNLNTKRILASGLLFSLAGVSTTTIFLLSGCGASSPPQSDLSRSKASVTLLWPAASRLIPTAASSITVSFLRGTTVIATQTTASPSNGGQVTLSFPSLPLGLLTVKAVAYPTTNGTGAALASASSSTTIAAGQTNTVRLTLGSTVNHVSISPTSANIVVGQTTTLTLSAFDVDGNTLLISPSQVTWLSLTPAKVTVSPTGVVTGISVGSAQIQALDAESGMTNNINVNVAANNLASVSVNPIAVVINLLGTQIFSATVNNITNQSVVWSIQEGPNGGSITSSGVYTAPNVAGTFHVIATSVADNSKMASATVTVN